MSLNRSITTRATSGTISNTFRSGYKVQISWSVNSQNVANNTSNVTVHAQLVSTGSSYNINSSATKNGSLTINGSTYNFNFNTSLSGGQTKTVYSKTVDIPHNSDGTKTFAMSTTLGINVTLSGTYWGNVTANGNGTLNSIPRTSSMSLSTTSIDAGNTITVNINRASTAFTHQVFYSFGSKRVTISNNASTSAQYTIPLDHLTVIPNNTSGTATISVDTYNGSTYIGSTSQNFTINVPASVKPSFSSLTTSVVDDGASPSYGYIKGKSKCALAINGASGNQGSSISSYSISGGGFSSSSQSFTTGKLTSAGDITFTAYVTDSRGRRSDSKTVSISVLDYMNPNLLEYSAFRCTSDGTIDDEGTYIKVSAKYTFTKLSGKNNATNLIEFKATTSGVWSNAGALTVTTSDSGDVRTVTGNMITGSNWIATDQSFDVRVTLKDNFSDANGINKTIMIPTSFVTMDIKRGGKGIAFGKASEADNLLDIGMNTRVTGTLSNIDGGTYVKGMKKLPQGTDLNNITETGFYFNPANADAQTMHNLPTQQAFSLLVEQHAGYKQTFSVYDPSDNRVWYRNYYVGTWGPWIEIPRGSLGNWEFGGQDLLVHKKRALVGFSNGELHLGYGGDFHDIRCNNGSKVLYEHGTFNTLHINNWFRAMGQCGLYFQDYGGGWHMTDGTWIRAYQDKNIYSGGRIKTANALEGRYIDAIQNNNIDISANGTGTIYFNLHASSGVGINFNKAWSGSAGSEPSIYNSKGNGWGFLGNSGWSFYRVYGSGGSVSDRNKKYQITKALEEEQYDNLKNINIYNYRSISTREISKEEMAENIFKGSAFRNEDDTYKIESLEWNGIFYEELDENLAKEEIKAERIKQIIEKNPQFNEVKRQDLMLGAMVDELPTEVTFYDNEGGDGKAVDMYSYTTMIAGATKHLINKVETLEIENEELRTRLDKMEEILNGIINRG
ncbi:Phage-related holin (Lysis protein) [[Clostridium] sordellii]|uniref:DUF859 family phage minor structural protein n=1 Tax=Paraclostridium sordellii TaxID=1505 RepID=UPI0005E14A49|nr:DUF859 family phage minor structural protein [Paeniclostridium sordellii]CEN30914.1 Phage-related holin (Lysis protein) [[Clostridium] sordellii] [Paeniclostridium sordellii]